MNSLIDLLKDDTTWQQFRQYKIENSMMSRRELSDLNKFVDNKYYKNIDLFNFRLPKRAEISKSSTSKKRVVYIFPKPERYILKLLTWLVQTKYDYLLSDNCYSFRQARTAKQAIRSIKHTKNIYKKYTLKIDIHDYFNSTPVQELFKAVEKAFNDDPLLIDFLKNIYFTNQSRINRKQIITEDRGMMAGVPIAGFFANLYLADLDDYFKSKNDVIYFRYSDDIIIITDTEERQQYYYNILLESVKKHFLTTNDKKLNITKPGQVFEFLGFKFDNGTIDIADHTFKKIKDKIRRKGRALYRWRTKNNVTYERTVKVMLRIFNNKFYGLPDEDDFEFNWCNFYFPEINTTERLKFIDNYLVQWCRYINSGRTYKGNYKIKYDYLKQLGFKSLVNAFYKDLKLANKKTQNIG